jgi:hypothetical protein
MDSSNEGGFQRVPMLFAIRYHARGGRTESEAKRVRELIMAWSPPDEVDVQNHYHYVSGGGVVVVEAESARSLYEMVEPFKPLVEFEVEPVLNVIEALAISLDIEDWVASVGEGSAEHREGDSGPIRIR